MHILHKKSLYPQTFNKIKDHYLDGFSSIEKLNKKDAFEIVGIFMNEILYSYPADMFLDVILNDDIYPLFKSFLLEKENRFFKKNLFIKVYQNYKIIFNELFDEAYDEYFSLYINENKFYKRKINA